MLAVTFSPDGSKLAAGGSDNTIRIFDAATGKLERIIEQHADWVTSLAFSHSGALLASASRDKSARLFDTETGEMEHSYLGHGDYVFGDYCSGRVWVIPHDFTAVATLPTPFATGYDISSFGEASDGKLYLVDYAGGAVYRLTDS